VALLGRKKRVLTRILVVEDEPLVAFDTEHFLRGAGFDVVATVDRAGEAVTIIDSGVAIDLVLADVRLADGTGIDVARAAHAAGIHVLFVTGECPSHARALASGCLPKPYAKRDLLGAIEAIEAVMHGRKPRRMPPGFSLFLDMAEG